MFANLSGIDILYAAIAAFILTQMILHLVRIRKLLRKEQASVMGTGIELETIIDRCKAMFPIPEVDFNGKSFQSGAIIRITTLQKNIIEGKLIGKNNRNILCVLTKHHIIAHEVDKILEIVMIEEEKEPKQ